jgi:hypothetical protein
VTNAPAATNASAGNSAGTAIWIALIAGLTVIGSYGYACAAPLAAVAALAALKMERTDGLILVGLAWIINQAVGFLLLSYPHTIDSYLWGAAIGVAAFAGFFAARIAARADVPALAGWVITFLVAFAGYQVALYLAGLAFTDPSSGFTAEVVTEVFTINAVAYAGFAVVYLAAVALSLFVPTRRAPAQSTPSAAVSA